MIANCPDPKQLKSLSLGQLDEEQSDVLILHLESCKSCQQEIAQIDSSEDSLIAQLKSSANETEDTFSDANGCRVAMTRAMAAFANAPTSSVPSTIPKAIGEYEIVRPLGHGGMGHVYLGKHTKLNRMVAIKFIANHRLWDQTLHDRFESEMRLIGGLKHPNIVSAYDAREVDGLAVLVTEFIDGMTLSEILKRTRKIDVANASKIVADVCEALQYIDSKGLVHRDIKPSNIMIDQEGNVKLLDLGLARIQQSADTSAGFSAVEFTATGQAMGTADYVPPEQIKDGRNVDIRSDIYGLGCTFYKLLTGKAPFDDHTSAFSKMNAHVSETPISLKTNKLIPAKIAKLVDSMLAKEPGNRPQHPADVAQVLKTQFAKSELKELVLETQALPIAKSKPPQSTSDKLQPQGSFFSRIPWAALVASAAAGLFGFWLGIMISVKKPDGSTATVEIPDGSTAVVDADGNIEIQLAGLEKTARIDKSHVELHPGATKNGFTPHGTAPAPQISMREKFMRQARDYELHSLAIAGEPVELSFHEQSLLNWTNQIRGADQGINVLWKDEGLPMAFGTLFQIGGSIRHSLTSLSEYPLRGIYRGEGSWTPVPGIEWQPWKSGKVTIAKTEALRMVQMKDIAKQFEFRLKSDGKLTELDLIPEPLHRFSSKKHGVVDGVVMAFAEGTDAEALLVLRADENDNTWKYACARCGWYEMSGTVDGRQVWKVNPVHSVNAQSGDLRFLKSPYVSGRPPFERDTRAGFDADAIGVFTRGFNSVEETINPLENAISDSPIGNKPLRLWRALTTPRRGRGYDDFQSGGQTDYDEPGQPAMPETTSAPSRDVGNSIAEAVTAGAAPMSLEEDAALQIKSLSDACLMYKLNTGTFPVKLEDLIVQPRGMSVPVWAGPYLEAKKIPLDPWQNAYKFSANETTNQVFISSAGKDLQHGTKDDIKK